LWRLWVAIADVAHYVESGSALDQEAIKRGNSVYFPQRVIPMLPEVLSNGLCSLNPKVDRLTLVCEMKIDSHGELLEYQFMEACIHSKARLTYTEVAAFLENGDAPEKFGGIKDDIKHLHELYKALKKKRDQRGAINVETTESRFIFNAEKKIESVVPVVRNVAHQIIEEAMLIANVCAAMVLQEHKLPALYRVHDSPTEAKITDLKDYLLPLGFRFSAGKEITPAHFQEVIAFASGRKDQALINIIVLRSMQQAVYSAVCSQHFGLAYEQYAHFTSPIRRYPDLVVHRAIKYLVRSKLESRHVKRAAHVKPLLKNEMLVEDQGKLAELAQYVSATERRADLATRDATDWLKCEFMLDKVGETFKGKISSVTAFGLFVLLDDIFIEGLVHISDLQNDYYHYDDRRHELRGEQSKKVFCLADPVTIQVSSVNLDDKKIEFLLIVDDEDLVLMSGKKRLSKGKKSFSKGKAGKKTSEPGRKKSKKAKKPLNN
jgi:ribonuclease R